MASKYQKIQFHSPLADYMRRLVAERQACGYKFEAGARALMRLDEFLTEQQLDTVDLPWPMVQRWTTKRPNEADNNHQRRVAEVRQLAQYMCRMGVPMTVLTRLAPVRVARQYLPHIFTHGQISQILKAVDNLAPTSWSPLRHRAMPEIFRLLYTCGFRAREVLDLKVKDVDFQQGLLRIREAKFGKDRLVPPSVSLIARLQAYANGAGVGPPEDYFFASPKGGAWSSNTVYDLFRRLLLAVGIPHGGRRKGPRLHDLRHTFAVHALLRWFRDGADLNAKLPVLATFMGHESLNGTQRYLHLTAELYPEIIRRSNASFGSVIPGGTGHEAH
jgi:integrase/recombinase XerD